MKYKIISEIPECLHKQILQLIHESFSEYLKNNLIFTCSSYTIEDLKGKVLSGKCFCALSEDDQPLGITSISLFEGRIKWAYENISATSSSYKRMGIGSALYNARTDYLRSNGFIYLLSDTAVNATSSVNWHLKACKCSIVGYQSFKNTNYYSYVFREDIVPVNFLKRNFLYKARFFLAYIKNGLLKKVDGNYIWKK